MQSQPGWAVFSGLTQKKGRGTKSQRSRSKIDCHVFPKTYIPREISHVLPELTGLNTVILLNLRLLLGLKNNLIPQGSCRPSMEASHPERGQKLLVFRAAGVNSSGRRGRSGLSARRRTLRRHSWRSPATSVATAASGFWLLLENVQISRLSLVFVPGNWAA